MVVIISGGDLHDVVGVWCVVGSGGEFSDESSEGLDGDMVDVNVAVGKEHKRILAAMTLTWKSRR